MGYSYTADTVMVKVRDRVFLRMRAGLRILWGIGIPMPGSWNPGIRLFSSVSNLRIGSVTIPGFWDYKNLLKLYFLDC